MVDRQSIQLSRDETEQFLQNLMHPTAEVEEARRAFLRSAEQTIRTYDEDGGTRIVSSTLNENAILEAIRNRRSFRAHNTTRTTGLFRQQHISYESREYKNINNNSQITEKQYAEAGRVTFGLCGFPEENSIYLAA